MAGKFDINPKTGKQYGINPSSGVMDDNYWANVVEPQLKYGSSSSGSSGSDMASNIAKQFMEEAANLFVKPNQEFDAYLTANPFSFDEAFAKSAVESEYNPWYKEKLDRYTVSAQRQLKQGLSSAGQSYESAGMYSSGQRMSAQGKIKEYAGAEQYATETDLDRQRRQAIEGGVLGRKQEAMQDYQLQVGNKQRSLFSGTSFPYPGYGGSLNG